MATEQNATRSRRSIRRYQPTPIPEGLIREVLEEGRWAPSATNTQSTAVYVLTGASLDRLRASMREQVLGQAEGVRDIPSAASMPEPYQARTNRLFEQRAAFIAAEEGREGTPPSQPGDVTPASQAMADFFGAPALLVFALDRRLPNGYACFDAGLFVQNTALAAHIRGLGTCIMTSPLRYGDVLHSALPTSEGQDLVAVMTVGYADGDAAINRFPRERIPLDEFATFVR